MFYVYKEEGKGWKRIFEQIPTRTESAMRNALDHDLCKSFPTCAARKRFLGACYQRVTDVQALQYYRWRTA